MLAQDRAKQGSVMRKLFLLSGVALVTPTAATAADQLKFGGPPAWVRPHEIPAGKQTEAPIALLLSDEQIAFEPGKVTDYNEGAIKIVNAQGLAAGNLSVVWQPSTETVTVNRLNIIRDGKVIDVLAGGQTFTILRRETNLDAATLDGTLTANIQPEGLQVGDVVVLATTTERSDPVLRGHVESMFAAWDALPIQQAYASLRWPKATHLQIRETPTLPAARRSTDGSASVLEISAQGIEPLVPPKEAPERFKIGRLAEATDYTSWSDLAATFIPLFREASVIPPSGALHDEVEKIRAASTDPKKRAQQALVLVQDRIRYVALVMGRGGYVPASAETTWSRRFGDCKAKTALLLGILHSLGIDAEPVLVQSSAGDMVADRLPMIALFDHVLVRAHIESKDYWLDGTRSGDTDLDAIEVPDFGWGLPLAESSKLVQMVPAPLRQPLSEMAIGIDASAGIYAPATIKADETVRGDAAVAYNSALAGLTEAQRKEFFDAFWKKSVDDLTPGASSYTFDKNLRQLHLIMQGTVKLDWSGGFFHLPSTSIGFSPDLERPAGPLHDAPVSVSFPIYTRIVTDVHFPPSFFPANIEKLVPAPVHKTLIGIEYSRIQSASRDSMKVETTTRSLVPEVSYKEAIAQSDELKALADGDVSVREPANYHATAADLPLLKVSAGASADELVSRGNILLNSQRYDDAIADFTKALELNPKDVTALADRALTYVWNNQLELAEKDLSAAKALGSDNAVLSRAEGLYLERKGDWKAATTLYGRSLQTDPASEWATERKIATEMQGGMFDQALSDVDRLLARDPNSWRFHLARAKILASQRKKDEALREIAAVEKLQAPDEQTATLIGSIYQELGLSDRAKEQYKQAIAKSSPGDANSLSRKAQMEYQIGNRKEALTDSEKALALDPHQQELRMLRANILYIQGDKVAVEAEAKALTRDNPTSDFAYVGAAKIYARLGMNDEAFKAFDRAIAISPRAYIYINRSQIRPKTDFKGRMADLDAALKLEPSSFEALYAKSELLRDSGDYAGALAALNAVDAGSQAQLRTQRAYLLYKSGYPDEAIKQFEAIRASTTDPMELNNLCYDKATAGIMLESALQDCNEALKLSPDNPSFEDSLGMVYLKLGKLDDAIATYGKVLAQNPVPASYLGRAFAYQRKGDLAAAQKDRAEANSRMPGIEIEFAGYGLKFDTAPPDKSIQTPEKK